MAYQHAPPPGFDFSAPVIRLGAMPGEVSSRPPRAGLGSNAEPIGSVRNLERDRAAVRESMMALQPPTREEVARTIFIGGLGEDVIDDEVIESILRCAGKLRRWTRTKDADDKKCKFGFAEYEDVESLEAAAEMFGDGPEVPMVKNGLVVKNEYGESKKTKLLVVVDEQSRSYIDEWKARRREDDDARQFRIDGCKEDLRQSLASIENATSFGVNQAAVTTVDNDGDTTMMNRLNKDGDIVTIPISANIEDELSDIPAEQRATVAAEIRAFRERSTKRDIERLRREEELEQAERRRMAASPPRASAASGPNGAPVGPRGPVPAGPRGFRGVQIPSDYADGVTFVNSNREDEDAEESDDELERRRQAKKSEEDQRLYQDAERRWLNRERTRAAAQQREREREEREAAATNKENDAIAKRLRAWDDAEEERLGHEEYYYNHSEWLRRRAAYREREEAEDKRDRDAEEHEKADERRRAGEAQGQAENFLDQMGAEIGTKPRKQPGDVGGGFKISLGSAAARTRAAAVQPGPKRAFADVEGLLEDEEDAAASGNKRPELKPLTDLSTIPTDLSDEEKAAARQSLVSEIPTDPNPLFAWPIRWSYLTPDITRKEIRPFVEKKVVEYLGVQEDLLVDAVMDGLRDRKDAAEITHELEAVLEDEAMLLVKKVWRMVVFWSEAGARGLV